jgi:hypothetical protein
MDPARLTAQFDSPLLSLLISLSAYKILDFLRQASSLFLPFLLRLLSFYDYDRYVDVMNNFLSEIYVNALNGEPPVIAI